MEGEASLPYIPLLTDLTRMQIAKYIKVINNVGETLKCMRRRTGYITLKLDNTQSLSNIKENKPLKTINE